jgi:hypothetical protein
MDRNPTVDDLVVTEDDRLALLESRLERMHHRVTEQIRSIEEFLETHAVPHHHGSSDENSGEHEEGQRESTRADAA